jgi:hypothetical protein
VVLTKALFALMCTQHIGYTQYTYSTALYTHINVCRLRIYSRTGNRCTHCVHDLATGLVILLQMTENLYTYVVFSKYRIRKIITPPPDIRIRESPILPQCCQLKRSVCCDSSRQGKMYRELNKFENRWPQDIGL